MFKKIIDAGLKDVYGVPYAVIATIAIIVILLGSLGIYDMTPKGKNDHIKRARQIEINRRAEAIKYAAELGNSVEYFKDERTNVCYYHVSVLGQPLGGIVRCNPEIENLVREFGVARPTVP